MKPALTIRRCIRAAGVHRSVTGVEVGNKRAARNPATGKTEYVEKKLTYEEWRKKYVEENADKKRVGRISAHLG